MPKPVSPFRARASTNVVNGVKRFSKSLPDQAMIDAGVGLFIIVALSMLLLRNYQRPYIEQLPVGSVATTAIAAPEDLKIEDTVETKRQRDHAAMGVLPVFDFNPRSARDATISLQEMFAAGHDAEADATVDQLRAGIEEGSGIILEPEQVEVLVKHQFDSELEQLMINHLESATMTPILNSRSQLRRLGATIILRRDVKSGQETAINDLSTVRDKITASASLRSEKLMWPAEVDPRERKLLGEILGSLVTPNFE